MPRRCRAAQFALKIIYLIERRRFGEGYSRPRVGTIVSRRTSFLSSIGEGRQARPVPVAHRWPNRLLKEVAHVDRPRPSTIDVTLARARARASQRKTIR